MRKVLVVIMCLMVISVAVFAGGDQEKTDSVITIKAQGTGPLGYPAFDAMYVGFEEKVEEATGGRVMVDFYPLQSLAPDREFLELMEMGSADVYMGSSLTLGLLDPRWNVTYLPFIFEDRAEMYRFMEGEVGQILSDSLLEEYGIRVLAYGESGNRSFSNNERPLRVPSDAAGLKIRSPETKPLEDWMKTLGIDPVVLSFPEMIPALQQGVIDGQDIELLSGRILGLQKLQKYWNNVTQLWVPIPLSISEKTWQKLPDDLKAIVKQAAVESAMDQRAMINEESKQLAQWAADEGIEYVEVTPEEWKLWADSAKASYKDQVDLIGEDMMDKAFNFLGKSWR